MRPKTTTRRTRLIAVAGAVLAAVTALSACGSSDAGGGGGKVKLSLGRFGNFGYTDLIKEYQAAHPNIEITERTASYSDHHKNLAAHLATGGGAADIEAIDTGYVAQFKANPDKFVDLNTVGGDKLKDRWLAWKWSASLAKGGQQIGYGADVGGLAICYRRDLFEKAQLPAARDAVSALWPTWQAFFETGKRFQSKAPNGVKFLVGGLSVLFVFFGLVFVGFFVLFV